MWNELVTTALLGTERRELKLDNAPEPFRDLAAALADAEPERALLALAGALTLHRRAGQMPGVDMLPLPEPCDLDDLPPCSPRAGLILGQILGLSIYRGHLQEWIAAAAHAGQRVSDEYLPRFLSCFERRGDLPAHFYDVLGKRGRWLARQNELWAYAVLPETRTNADSEHLSLVATMPIEREAHFLRVIGETRQSRSLSEVFAQLMQSEPATYCWSRVLTLTAIGAIREILPGQSAVGIDLAIPNLPRLAMQFSPTCVPELQALADVDNKSQYAWTNAVKKAVATLEFRQNMLKEFAR